MHRYAWLELDGRVWHLLTDLFANPGESTRSWSDKKRAFAELMEEGWMVVRPYSEMIPTQGELRHEVHGYGLTRQIH